MMDLSQISLLQSIGRRCETLAAMDMATIEELQALAAECDAKIAASRASRTTQIAFEGIESDIHSTLRRRGVRI